MGSNNRLRHMGQKHGSFSTKDIIERHCKDKSDIEVKLQADMPSSSSKTFPDLPSCIKWAEQTLEMISKHCVLNCTQYVDAEFAAHQTSISTDPQDKLLSTVKYWDRAQSHSSCDLSYNHHQYSAADIVPGVLGETSCISAMRLVAHQPKLLDKVIITKDSNKVGVFCVCLYEYGVWKAVLVDDYLPYKRDRTLAFSQGREQQAWVPLLEKALAKHLGGYAASEECRTSNVIKLLTGHPIEVVKLDKFSVDSIEPDSLYDKLRQNIDEGLLVGAETCGLDPATSHDSAKLEQDSTYAVVHYKSTQCGDKLLCVQELKESRSGSCLKKIAADYRREKCSELSVDTAKERASLIWIDLATFTNFFTNVLISYTRNCWYSYHLEGSLLRKKDTFYKQFQLQLDKPTHMDLQLEKTRESDDLIEAVLVISDNRGNIIDSTECKELSNILWSGRMKAGTYQLSVISFSKWRSSEIVNVLLTCCSQKSVDGAIKAVNLHTFTECVMRLVEANGDEIDSCSGDPSLRMYCLEAPLWYGTIVMVVNSHPTKDFCTRIMFKTANMISTRTEPCVETTKDKIPPNSRQIVQIYTCANGKDPSGYFVEFQTGVFECGMSSYAKHCKDCLTAKTADIHNPISNCQF